MPIYQSVLPYSSRTHECGPRRFQLVPKNQFDSVTFFFLFFFVFFFIINNFLIMEFDYTQTNKQVQVMALRLERGGELGGDVAINRRCHATGRWLVDQRGAWKSWRNL